MKLGEFIAMLPIFIICTTAILGVVVLIVETVIIPSPLWGTLLLIFCFWFVLGAMYMMIGRDN